MHTRSTRYTIIQLCIHLSTKDFQSYQFLKRPGIGAWAQWLLRGENLKKNKESWKYRSTKVCAFFTERVIQDLIFHWITRLYWIAERYSHWRLLISLYVYLKLNKKFPYSHRIGHISHRRLTVVVRKRNLILMCVHLGATCLLTLTIYQRGNDVSRLWISGLFLFKSIPTSWRMSSGHLIISFFKCLFQKLTTNCTYKTISTLALGILQPVECGITWLKNSLAQNWPERWWLCAPIKKAILNVSKKRAMLKVVLQ